MTKSRSRSTQSSAAGKSRQSSRRRSRARRPLIQLTRDQWLDLLGGALLLSAVLTILSLLSPQQGALLHLWLAGLERLFGWGMFIAPLLIGATGLWLILRRFGERFPQPQPEQIAGVARDFQRR